MLSYEALRAIGIEWVNPSADGRRAGYYRRIARTREEPTVRQAEHRLIFAEAAYNTFMTKGVTKTQDNREIPTNAKIIGNKLQGTGQPRRVLSFRAKLLKLILEA